MQVAIHRHVCASEMRERSRSRKKSSGEELKFLMALKTMHSHYFDLSFGGKKERIIQSIISLITRQLSLFISAVYDNNYGK